MVNFWFLLFVVRHIGIMNIDHLDNEKLKGCYRCGKCSSGCAVNRLDPSFQPHRILHLIAKGPLDKLLADDAVWRCTTCFTCSERCPQGITATDILWSLRALAAKSGSMSEMLSAQKETLFRTGRLYPTTALDIKKREKAGLPALSENSSVIGLIFEAAKADK